MSWYDGMLRQDNAEIALRLVNAATYSRKHSTGAPFVARFDGVWDLGNSSSPLGLFEQVVSNLKNRRLKECLLDCRKVVFQSEFSRSGANSKFERILTMPQTIICNPVRIEEEWSGLWNRHSGAGDAIRIVSYHRHTPLKCSHLAVEFASRLASAQSRPVQLTIIGSAPKIVERRIGRAIAALSNHEVAVNRMSGDIDTFVKFAAVADFVLNLAHFDPCPNVVCEAVGLGVPQIVVASGGIPEILGADYPFFLKPFAKHRSWLVANSVETVDWQQFLDVADNVLRLNCTKDIYAYAVDKHHPDAIYNAYKSFTR